MQNHKVIKLAIADITPKHNEAGFINSLLLKLQEHFNIKLTSLDQADYLFYGDFGVNHIKFKGTKIFFTGENHAPDWNACDYAFTHEIIQNDRHLRMPFYVHTLMDEAHLIDDLKERKLITMDEFRAQNRGFCNFVYRNHVCRTRNRFFKKLSQYKKVDSAGPFKNNMGGYLLPKGYQHNRDFASKYKFTISFENESHLGYTTEKITHPLLGRSLPIYWGNRLVTQDFNERSFLNYFSYQSEDELIEKIIELDNNDELLLSLINEPCYIPSDHSPLDWETYLRRFEEIFHTPRIHRKGMDQVRFYLNTHFGRLAIRRWQMYRRTRRLHRHNHS